MRNLDFMVIGAQKAGTTSLFKYIGAHPAIRMPAEKEAPFFCFDDTYARGWEAFGAELFPGLRDDVRIGKATPHYMCDPLVAERVHRTMPEVKLIAALRDPVERAYSHYKMAVRRGSESRPFAKAVEHLLDPARAEHARRLRFDSPEVETHCYLAWGEYGRVLAGYRKYFPAAQLLVLFAEELATDPAATVKEVFRFLDVDDGFVPPNLGKRYHRGGTRRRFDRFAAFSRNSLTRAAWRLLPPSTRRSIWYWYEQKNVVPESDDARTALGADLYSRVVDHFREDCALLADLTGDPVPWPALRPAVSAVVS